MTRWIVFLVLLSSLLNTPNMAFSQVGKPSTYQSVFPTKGNVNILILFASGRDSLDAQPGSTLWLPDQLPVWANGVLTSDSIAMMGLLTAFFKESSFNTLNIYGDYHTKVLDLRNSTLPDIKACGSEIRQLTAKQKLETAAAKKPVWFDNWMLMRDNPARLVPGHESSIKFDHVMVIIRSSVHNAYVSGHTKTTQFFGIEADTWSFVSSDGRMPLSGMKAALGQLILGPYSGQDPFGEMRILPSGSWALSSPGVAFFQTVTAYERSRLAWKKGKSRDAISCLDREGKPINSDLDAWDSNHEGSYILRDFVPTGDALRIKLPYRDAEGRKQYIWLENHLTSAVNNSAFDNFDKTCENLLVQAKKGVYAYLQKEEYASSNVSFLSLPAGGFNRYPKTSTDSEQSNIGDPFDLRRINSLDLCKDASELAFSFSGYRSLNVGTNPSTSIPDRWQTGDPEKGSMATKGAVKQHRIVFLNGLSIELIKEYKDGAIEVRVIFDDTWVENNNIWSADSIVVPAVRENELYSLALAHGRRISLVAGNSFAEGLNRPSSMLLLSGAIVYMERDAVLDLQKGSILILHPESKLVLREGAKLKMGPGSRVIVMPGARIVLPDKRGILVDKEAVFEIGAETIVRDDGKSHKIRGANMLN